MSKGEKVEVKKGNKPSWRPGHRLGFLKVPQGYTGRWCSGDEANIQKKIAEGWIPVNKTTVPSGEHVKPYSDHVGADSMAGAIRYQELVGMMLPDELKASRDEYHKDQNLAQIKSKVMVNDAQELGRHKNAIKSYITIE